MSDCNTSASVLGDLQKLDEAGRSRILKLLSPESVMDILKESLREREKSTNSTASQGQSHADAHREPTRPTTIEHAAKTASEWNGSSTKWGTSVVVLRYRKRFRNDKGSRQNQGVLGREIIEIESEEENDQSKDLSKDDPPAGLPNERTRQRHPNDNGAAGPIELREEQPKMPPTYLVIKDSSMFPKGLGSFDEWMPDTHMSIDSLPAYVRAELERRLDNMWSAHKQSIAGYTASTQNLRRHASYPSRCMHKMLVQCELADGPITGRVRGSSSYACRYCTAAGYPCARLIWREYADEAVVHWVPLSTGLRKGKSWDEVGYWVRPELDTRMTLAS